VEVEGVERKGYFRSSLESGWSASSRVSNLRGQGELESVKE